MLNSEYFYYICLKRSRKVNEEDEKDKKEKDKKKKMSQRNNFSHGNF